MTKNKKPGPVSEAIAVIKAARINAIAAVLVALIAAAATFIGGVRTGKRTTLAELSAGAGGMNEKVIMLGSGTVFKYLQAHKIIDTLSDPKKFNVPILEGPTETAAELFGSAFEKNSILVMAANRLDITQLRRRAKGQPGTKPEYVFEVYLGVDPLYMLLVTSSNGDADSRLERDFGNILGKSRNGKLRFENICDIEGWLGGKYKFYAGSEGSGTTVFWKEELDKLNCKPWPSGHSFWDIKNLTDMTQPDEARVYLGSRVLNEAHLKSLEANHVEHKNLAMFNGEKPAERGLYLYGVITNTDSNMEKQYDAEGYKLPPDVANILRLVFNVLENSPPDLLPGSIKTECIDEQRRYFHLLDSSVGWVEKTPTPPKGNVYRPEVCLGRPEEEARMSAR
ncbi:MAG: hypothetical protein ABW250_01635 [Pyrinomonadaceae bacterium]